MKKTTIALAILLAASTGTFAQTQQEDSTKTHKMKTSKGTRYTCTMHPEVVMNKPGKCPKCGMDLVAVKQMKHAAKKPVL
ncbi:MAG: heavy metal-binding domain-containing protein [Ferruginibacter sp.]